MPSVGAAVRSRQHWLLFGGVASLIVIHLWSSAHVGDPTVVFDENGYLGNARWLAGGATWEMPFAPAYSSALPVVARAGHGTLRRPRTVSGSGSAW